MRPPSGHVAAPAPAGETSAPAAAWRRFVPVLALLAIAALLFHADFAAIAARWSLGNESHGLPIALLIPVMFWRVAPDVPARSEGAWLPALAAGVVAAAAYVLLRAAWISGLSWAAIPAILLCAVWVALGARAARAVALPLACLLFAIPIWDDFVTPVLQALTVAVASKLVLVLGIPAAVEGNIVHVPAGTFEIAAGCAGTRYFVVSLATACLVAVLDRLQGRRLALAVGSAVALALVANWVRVVAIIAIGEASDMTSPIVAHHDSLGWWIYAAFLLPYFLFVRRLVPPAGTANADAGADVDAAGRVSRRRLIAAGALLAVAPVWSAAVLRAPATDGVAAPVLPPLVGAWRADEPVGDDWRPVYPGAAAAQATYVSGQGAVDAFVGTYGLQRPGQKLIGLPSTPVAGRVPWLSGAAGQVRIAADTQATELRLEGPAGAARLLRYWYVVGGTVAADELGAKAREALRAFGATPRSSIVAISTACDPDCTVAAARLDDFGSRWWPELRPRM